MPRGPIPSVLCGFSTGERDAVLGRHLVIIRAPRPVGHPTSLIANDRAFRRGSRCYARSSRTARLAGLLAPLPWGYGVCISPQSTFGGPGLRFERCSGGVF